MQLSNAIRQRIINLAKAKKMKVRDVAIKAGINPSTLSNFMLGFNKTITLHKLYLVCLGLDIDLVDFFDDKLFINVYDENEKGSAK